MTPGKRHTARNTGAADAVARELPGSAAWGLHAVRTALALLDAGGPHGRAEV